MGRLFQGAGIGNKDGQRIKGTATFFFIPRNKVPTHKVKKVTHARIACTIREMKSDKHRTIIAVGRNSIK